MSKFLIMIMAAATALAMPAALFAQQTDTAPAPAPAAEAAPQALAAPAAEAAPQPVDRTLVRLCDRTLTASRLTQMLSNMPPVPPEAGAQALNQIVQGWIVQQLVGEYAQRNELSAEPELVQERIEEIRRVAAQRDVEPEELMEATGMTEQAVRDLTAFEAYQQRQTSPEKAQEFVKAHPRYFDGTEVRARHILIGSSPFAPTADQVAARTRLEEIAVRLAAGEVTFEQAAQENSDCPSRGEGGDLGFFPFHQMVGPFAKAAFEAEKGKVLPIVWTRFGWHLIEVTDVRPGQGEPQPVQVSPDVTLSPEQLARHKLSEMVEDDLLRQTHQACELSYPAPNGAPAPAAPAQ